jgi:glutamine amidotransferase
MIVIVDYGMGNLRSVAKAFQRLGKNPVVTSDPKIIQSAKRIILPGVGHFRQGMQNLNSRKVMEVLSNLVLKEKCPLLGICLGMQLLSKHSEEGDAMGLGWVDAETYFLGNLVDRKIKVPHMGWNSISIKKNSILLKDIPNDTSFYFVHSYFCDCHNTFDILAQTEYGITFTSAFESGNIFAVQFHPEKSHDAGLQILTNFINL